MASVSIFLLVVNLIYIFPDKYFETVILVAKSYVAVCFNYFFIMAIF